jgi:kynurenine formamidase
MRFNGPMLQDTDWSVMMTPVHSSGRNWGRWGTDDERGALNLLVPDIVQEAARLVVRGQVYPLGRPFAPTTPVPSLRPAPVHEMTRFSSSANGRRRRVEFSDDIVTHIDALAHVWYDDQLYNGFASSEVDEHGAARCGVDRVEPIVGRGVLLDVAGYRGVDVLADDTRLTADDLGECARHQDTEIRAGDIVLIRTGWWTARAAAPDHGFEREPGPEIGAGHWLADRDVSAVGADNFAFEALPADGDRLFPVHELLLRDCGVPIVEGLMLDAIASERIYEFMFVAAVLPLTGATASPLNPLAIA